MGKVYEGQLLGAGLKFALVVSRFNEFISRKLLKLLDPGDIDGVVIGHGDRGDASRLQILYYVLVGDGFVPVVV